MQEDISNYLLTEGFYAPILNIFESELHFIFQLSLIQFPSKGQKNFPLVSAWAKWGVMDKVKQINEHLQNQIWAFLSHKGMIW